jgi:heptosyltransferase I
MEGVEFIVINKPNNLRDYWHFYQKMKKRRFDVLLAAQASFRANLLYACIKAKRKIGYDKIRAKDGHSLFINEAISSGKDHTLEGFLKFAEQLDKRPPTITWDLPISEEAKQWAAQHTQGKHPLLLVNPAASKEERSWLVERYVEVILHAQKKWGMQVILTGGPGAYDAQLTHQISQQIECVNLAGKTKPKQLLALISQAQLMLCPDTGPSHMAAAVGTPVIALHAVTSAEVSGPYTFKHLAVDYYPAAMETILQTTPESNRWGTHAHGKETMQLIPTEAVIDQLDKVMSNAR